MKKYNPPCLPLYDAKKDKRPKYKGKKGIKPKPSEIELHSKNFNWHHLVSSNKWSKPDIMPFYSDSLPS